MQEEIRRSEKNFKGYSGKQTKTGSNASANVFTNPDCYGSEKEKEKIKERLDKAYVSDVP